jgi:outer membrane protein OmpA-like peptidoglycan-associated protein/tetratricopeptide (TPR) repeat protein
MKKILTLFFITYSLFAQSKKTSNLKISIAIREAEKEYDGFRYLDAIPKFQYVIKIDSLNINSRAKLADCYYKLKDYKKAESTYRALFGITDTLKAEHYLKFAEILGNNKNYTESGYYYKKYSDKNVEDTRGEKYKDAYFNTSKFYKDSSAWKLIYLNINTSLSDFGAMFYKKGIAFCSNRVFGADAIKRVYTYDNSAFIDIYCIPDSAKLKPFALDKEDSLEVSKRKGKIFYNDDDTYITSNDTKTLGTYSFNYIDSAGLDAKANRLVQKFSNKINSKFHEGPFTFDPSNDTIFFTRSNYYKGRAKKTPDRTVNLKIFMASVKDSVYGNVKPININSDKYSIGHPTMSNDGKKMYFVSDMPGGFGGTDIYVCDYLGNGNFSEPKNLGLEINTTGNEMFPFIDEKNRLYFSSTGHPGLGGLDVFVANPSQENEANVRNLGYPVNTSYDDFGFIARNEGRYGFLSSNRKRGSTDDDIYMFRFNPAGINGKVLDKRTEMPLDSAVTTLYEVSEGGLSVVDSVRSGKNGLFKFNNIQACKSYKLISRKNGFTIDTKDIKTDCKENKEIELVQKIEQPVMDVLVYYPNKNNEGAKDASLKLYDITEGTERLIFDVLTDSSGKWNSKLPICKKYKLVAFKEGYPEQIKNFETNCNTAEDISLKIPLANNPCVVIYSKEKASKTIIPEAKIEFIDKEFNKIFEANTDKNGELAAFKCPTEKIRIIGSKQGFFTTHLDYTPNPKKKSDTLFFTMPELKLGMTIALEGILFDLNKFNIRPDAAKIFDEVVQVMKDNPTLEIELSSHTDSRGSDSYNFKLSDSRAKSSATYIVSQGIDEKRIVGQGYGETKLLNKCGNNVKCDEKKHQINRRTEVRITKY